MVDGERVLRILDGIRRDIEAPEGMRARSDEETVLDAIKYRFVTGIEGSARAAHHIVVSEGWVAPDSSADAFRALADHDVISNQAATELGRAVEFRNALVHGYAEVDDERVIAMLDRLGDLHAYVAAVASWVAEQ